MNERLQLIYSRALWVSTIVVLVLMSAQAWSGNWITFFSILPGGPPHLAPEFLTAMVKLSTYHAIAGFATGGIALLVLIFAFLHRSSIYVRVFAVLGFLVTCSAAIGGYLFVTSEFSDRWSLGQMADSFVGAYAAYFLQLFFLGKTSWPWSRKRSRIAENP